MSSSTYLLAGQVSELERLQLQSQVWEPSGRRLLEEIGQSGAARAADIGCGVMGWLRVLSEWIGPDGEVVGTDVDDAMLAKAERFVADEGLGNVVLRKDDLFATGLEPASFDLVHARYEVAPLGRGQEQLTTYLGLVRPGGIVVLEDPDASSWHFNPPAPALEKLIELIVDGFLRSGGDWNAGRNHLDLFRGFGVEANIRAEVFALPPRHPYLRLPLQVASALEPRLLTFVDADTLERLRNDAEAEVNEPGRWGTTFTLLQAWGRRVT
ncbi:MAG TPA: methyltransferase domain-containing protein [Acidimicrobiales bacterium]|jgi:SAM-dependent methyltransferase